MDCLFCSIIAGDIPSKKVYEDDVAYAFLDISPWQKGHSLVVPKRHTTDILVDDDVLAEIGHAVARVGRLLRDRLGADGFNVLANVGNVSGQEVFHTHVHVIPRYAENPGISNMRGRIDLDLDEVHKAINP
ncbi:HIT family protein [Tessaracoccus lubricantis]|uniref:HIT family protein n=1 Tax=Tessaracoccus lubricantis TaxID=545543 RepID=A0ABP9FIA2_9ACTN